MTWSTGNIWLIVRIRWHWRTSYRPTSQPFVSPAINHTLLKDEQRCLNWDHFSIVWRPSGEVFKHFFQTIYLAACYGWGVAQLTFIHLKSILPHMAEKLFDNKRGIPKRNAILVWMDIFLLIANWSDSKVAMTRDFPIFFFGITRDLIWK